LIHREKRTASIFRFDLAQGWHSHKRHSHKHGNWISVSRRPLRKVAAMLDFAQLRELMVSDQIEARGVRDKRVLDAIRKVPREVFVPGHLRDRAYEDTPLPIAEGQTISQPYIVAYMIEALALVGGEKVLEIGAGSGYAVAVLAEIAGQVYTIERIAQLAEKATSHLMDAGYENVHILNADGTRGWIEEAPFDAILVSAGAPYVPESLKSQLAKGGRMVVPVGTDKHAQELVRVTRREKGQFDREDLADVRFVPLIGQQGWEVDEPVAESRAPRFIQTRPRTSETLPGLISRHGESFSDIETADLDPLIARVGDRRVVLIGEASHGTSEFYRMRARITRRLIEEKGFNIVAVEADWPDAARIDNYVRHRDVPASDWEAFGRFPTWMWRNEEVREFVDWLHEHNKVKPYDFRAGFYGLDLYSLYNSTRAVIDYLEDVDPDLALIARHRYGCLSPWEADPAAYGHAALTGSYRNCEGQVVKMLVELHEQHQQYVKHDGERFLDAAQNAQLVANAERYYRIMYYGSRASWNLRDGHMFDTLQNLIGFHGERSKAVVWAHNSHIGDASATEMSARGEHNLGEFCQKGFGKNSYRIGFGTDHGTVAAASDWNGPMEIKQVQPAHPQSYERLFHLTNKPGLVLPLRAGHEFDVATELAKPRLERAIGVIYRPETELASHYFEAVLPRQFDEYIWIDETSAVSPIPTGEIEGMPDTYPFGV
jgi:protein-L-isoaspartate(D-aspartate) O-methyltransferase